MTGSRRVPAGTLATSTNATNGSGNPNVFSYSACEQDYMTIIFKELCNQYRSTLLLC